MLKLRTTDKIIVITCLSVALFCGYALINDIFADKRRPSSERQIASVESFINDGRVKGEKALHFEPIKKEETLFNNDRIYSGKDSYVDIKLNTGGGKLKLTPESMVTLKIKSDNTSFKLRQGTLKGELDSDETLKLADKNGIHDLKSIGNSNVSVNATDQGLEIKVLSGGVELQTKNGKKHIKKNQKIKIKKSGEVSKIINTEIELTFPKEAAVFWERESIRKRLSWKSTSNNPFREYQVVLSKDKKFKKPLTKETTQNESLESPSLSSGTYYWQVSTIERGKTVKSEVGFFSLFREKAPRLVSPSPKSDAIIPLAEKKKNAEKQKEKIQVDFVFEDSTFGRQFLLQVADNELFENPLLEKRVKGTRLNKIPLGVGAYFWRVKVDAQNRPKAYWSEPMSFSIQKEKRTLTQPIVSQTVERVLIPNQEYPKELYRGSHRKISEYLINNKIVDSQFSWQAGELLRSETELEIQHQTRSRNQIINGSQLSITDLRPNSLHQIKARLTRGEETGPWSNELKVQYELQSAKSLSPVAFDETWDGESKEGSAYIKWTPLLYAHGYEVVIGRDPGLKKAKSFLTRKPKYPFMIYFDRDYYWKVRPIDKKYKPISGFSKIFPVRVNKVIPKEPEIKVTETGAPIPDRKPASRGGLGDSFIVPEFWINGGVGINYVQFGQTVDGFADLAYESVKSPTVYANLGFYLTDSIGLEASYKDTIGEIKDMQNSGQVFEYNWKTYSVDLLYRGRPYKNDDGFIRGMQWVWRLGAQQHFMPFLDVPDISQLNVDLKENSILMANAGFSYFFATSPSFRYELTLRYQHPIASSNDSTTFEISPNFSFDGSIGATYRLSDHFNMGIHWYGQWHSFSYEYGEGANQLSGDQDIIFSNIDFRLGVEY